MNTKEFIKISKTLDECGLHRQADDLFKIAQSSATPEQINIDDVAIGLMDTKGGSEKVVTKKEFLGFNEDYKLLKTRLEKQINELKPGSAGQQKAAKLPIELKKLYETNKLDYISYKNFLKKLAVKSTKNKFTNINTTPRPPVNPTSFAPEPNYQPMYGSGKLSNGKPVPIQMAKPLEGVSAAGETAFTMREDTNLPALVQEWNDYYNSDSHKQTLQNRINELKNDEDQGPSTKDAIRRMEEILAKINSPGGLHVGDFGNDKETQKFDSKGKPYIEYSEENTKPQEIYGTEQNPAYVYKPRTIVNQK